MRCSKCGTEGIPGKKFCAECGSPFSNRCSNCNSDNAPGAKFCADCGSALGTDIVGERGKQSATEAAGGVRIAPERQTSETIEGERKTVTALFADIKDSTEMMRDLDPEDARAIIDPALKLMVEAVRRYDGYVVQSTGDGIFALFGAPAAYEDHPQRALYAALRMQEALREHAARLAAQGKPAPQARVGVNAGEVVMRTVETGGRVEYTPVGHVTNLAARLQGVAPAGGIVISEDTRRLVEGYFELLAWATAVRGWAMAKQGHNEGVALIQESLAAIRTTGNELSRPYFLTLLAEACINAGRLDDAFGLLTPTLGADMHRLKGEVLLSQDDSNASKAQSCFERAIQIARAHSAKSLELRATISLACLLEKQGHREEARAMLAEIYRWFTEGFDTADLKDAKALLDKLGD